MNSEKFSGNCYLFFPCYYSTYKKIGVSTAQINDFTNDYLVSFTKYFSLEVNVQLHQNTQRVYLNTINILYLDGQEHQDKKTIPVDVFMTFHKKTKLSVITLAIFNAEIPISNLLDRISQNNIEIEFENKYITLDTYLKNYGITKLNSGKVCLSAHTEIDDNIFPYYFANETYNSSVMFAKLKHEKFGKNVFSNIAQYDSSDLYVGKKSILRIDKRDYSVDKKGRIESDIIFLFIMEILIFKEASLERTNQKIVNYISNNKYISISELNKVSMEFSRTMPFWDINVFNYITAQNLANDIQKAFLIEDKYNVYLKNQKFLQHKLNLKQSIEQEKENSLLFYIAIILFSFEIYNVCKDFISSKPLSLSLATFIFILLLIYKSRKNKSIENVDE
ncbi:MAG: hypothetical protein RBT24_02645 [Arcobacteraceae bacterium]|jgi:hypothetical protein|nr:hypothetical protein [Arcobacteraceae bacterium]